MKTTLHHLFRTDRSITPKRGVHLDLKGLPPTADRLMELLKLFAAARYTVVLVEWEDAFPWTVDERFRSPTAYTPDEVRCMVKTADELGLELIPLVQCLGHMETPLSLPDYAHLRELPDDASGLNPLAEGARELIQSMVDDVLTLMPDVKHLHLGGDEAWTLGKHPDTQAYIEEHGKGALYLHHVEPILDQLNGRGIRPILWHDMMIHWDSDALRALALKSDLLVWGYIGHPDDSDHHFNTQYIQRFIDHGVRLWGGGAYKGADGHNIDLPVIGQRQKNALAWADLAQRFEFQGVIATAWSRYSTGQVQCEPIDAALDSLVNTAVILHDGHPPEGGIEACVTALTTIGEGERFIACKQAMKRLTEVRYRGWAEIQTLREQRMMSETDQRLCAQNMTDQSIGRLRKIMKDSESVAEEVRSSFDGLLESGWIEEYLSTRLRPLEQEMVAFTFEPPETD